MRRTFRSPWNFHGAVLKEVMGGDVRIFPISARLALEGKVCRSEESLRKSCLSEFSEALNRFLMDEKGMVLILSAANNLLRAISRAKFELELEMKSLTTPLDALKEQIEIFEKKKQEVLSEKDDFDLLLDGEAKKIINNVLEVDLTAFRHDLLLAASENFEKNYKDHTDMSLKKLRQYLEEQIIADVKNAYTAWRVREDEKLANAFETGCTRFVIKIDETVDALLTFSAELFSIPFDIVKAEAIWTTKSGFYYKFKDQPVGIEIVTSSLTLMLPKFIGEKIILRKMNEYLKRVIDMQAARIGYDFEQKIEKSKLSFRWEMLQRIKATLEGISAAIEKGVSSRSTSKDEVQKRTLTMLELLQHLNAIGDKLLLIKKQTA